jgi:hypothetical protein
MRIKKRVVPQWLYTKDYIIALSAACMIFAVAIPQNVLGKFVIDPTMPDTIPSGIIADWKAKDNAENSYSAAIEKIKNTLPDSLKAKIIEGEGESAYLSACHWRRVHRIQPYQDTLKRILYARHHDIGGSIIGFTEELKNDPFTSGIGKYGDQGSISRGGDYSPGGALLLLEMKTYYSPPSVLLEDKIGCIRDPCVSFDGKKVVFAWSKDNAGYHIYEMIIDNPEKDPVQLTFDPPGLTVSDFEPCYLPNGDIVLNSSRCFGYVDCNFNITSNLYIMNKEGKYLRRIGFDQLHTFYPTMMSDGKVLYSRWEYNDRNIATCFGLFSMNIDGTHQAEYFGNQTSWPATIPQGREIPNCSGKILAITGGHLGPYAGDLIIINTTTARNGSKAVNLVAPQRPNPVNPPLLYGVPDSAKLFQNPYPLDEKWFLISYRTSVGSKFRIYLMNIDGDRELLAWDAQSVSQQQPIIPRLPPQPIITYRADYGKKTGEVLLANAYYGDGVDSTVQAGSIKKIRVIALEYHTDPSFGSSGSQGYTMTPVGRWTASWMAKRILGEAKVESDGSSHFFIPAKTPVYFQLIDAQGCAIQSMRSWLTLQPGERFDCFGCHENKNNSMPTTATGSVIAKEAKELDSVYGLKNVYFHYPDYIQPILDEKCVRCHQSGKSAGAKLDLTGTKIWTGDLVNDPDNVNACRFWCKSYYNLTMPKTADKDPYVSYIDVNSPAEGLPPNSVGSVRSKLISILRNPPSGMNVFLNDQEMGKICMWIDLCIPHSGFYTDDMKVEDAEKYAIRLERREQAAYIEEKNIADFVSVGGYQSYSDGVYRPNKSIDPQIVKRRFTLRQSLSGQKLFIRVPCAGVMTLRDMLGRSIMTHAFKADVGGLGESIAMRKKLPKGIYIATFKGAALVDHQIISVF